MGGSKPLSYSTPNMRRAERNKKEMDNLRQQGHTVVAEGYPNNAYYAIESGANHYPHEIEVVKILAENGLSTALKKEGTILVGHDQLPSFDGKGHSMSFEIREIGENVERHLASKVADAISHSRKQSKKVSSFVIQADVAISYTKNSKVHEKHVKEGIANSKERNVIANPRYLLQIDGISRKVYLYKIKGG